MYTLEVYNAGATVTYSASTVEDQDYSIDESADQGSVAMQDVEVLVDGATFLGAADVYALPAGDGTVTGSWRARLLWNGALVMNGAIRRQGGIRHIPATGSWFVTIINDALDGFLTKCEDIVINDSLFLAGVAVITSYRQTYDKDEEFNDGLYVKEDMYRTDSILAQIVSTIGGTTFNRPGLFACPVKYTDVGGVKKTYTFAPDYVLATALANENDIALNGGGTEYVIPPSMPEMTARTFIEALQAYHGWRMTGAYSPYPSRNVTITAYGDVFNDPAGRPVLDNNIEEDGDPEYSIQAPYLPDLLVKLDYGDTSFERIAVDWPYGNPIPLPAGALEQPIMMRSGSVRSGNNYHLNDDDYESVVDVPYRIPHTHAMEAVSTWHKPDAANHPNLEMRITYSLLWVSDADDRPDEDENGDPTGGKLFMIPVKYATNPALNKYLRIGKVEFRTIAPAPAPAQFLTLFGVGAFDSSYCLYDFSERERVVVNLAVDTTGIGAFTVGDINSGVSLGGRAYAVQGCGHRPGTATYELQIERPL